MKCCLVPNWEKLGEDETFKILLGCIAQLIPLEVTFLTKLQNNILVAVFILDPQM